MKRRTFIAGLGSAAAWPVVARAQRPAVPVVGWLDSQSPESARESVSAFQQGLAETGYVEGRNVLVAYDEDDPEFKRRVSALIQGLANLADGRNMRLDLHGRR